MILASVTQFRIPSRPATASLPVAVEATSDHELMIAVRAGEIRRLGDLFERYHQPLYGFFVRLTNQPSVGEDLVQIVFYRILKYRHTYRDEGKFSAWIYHLARKVAADHFRKHASTPIPTDPADLLEQPDAGPQPSDQAATTEDVVLLRSALARLPLEHREVRRARAPPAPRAQGDRQAARLLRRRREGPRPSRAQGAARSLFQDPQGKGGLTFGGKK